VYGNGVEMVGAGRRTTMSFYTSDRPVADVEKIDLPAVAGSWLDKLARARGAALVEAVVTATRRPS
jgi:hypothetical protein